MSRNKKRNNSMTVTMSNVESYIGRAEASIKVAVRRGECDGRAEAAIRSLQRIRQRLNDLFGELAEPSSVVEKAEAVEKSFDRVISSYKELLSDEQQAKAQHEDVGKTMAAISRMAQMGTDFSIWVGEAPEVGWLRGKEGDKLKAATARREQTALSSSPITRVVANVASGFASGFNKQFISPELIQRLKESNPRTAQGETEQNEN